jgi:hypothetical protein
MIGFDGACFYMPPGLPPGQIKAVCIQLYKKLAKRDLTERTSEFAERLSVEPKAVKISNAKTLWGSCSAKKNINYSWRIIMAEEEVVDYLIVHELAHLLELNHSEKFWSIVENILPEYKTSRTKLRALQKKLSYEDWD